MQRIADTVNNLLEVLGVEDYEVVATDSRYGLLHIQPTYYDPETMVRLLDLEMQLDEIRDAIKAWYDDAEGGGDSDGEASHDG